MTDRIYDLHRDAPRFIAEALKVATVPLSVDDLAYAYDPPEPNNMADIEADYDRKFDGEYADATVELVAVSISEILRHNPGALQAFPGRDDHYALAEGVDADELRIDGEPLIVQPKLNDPFNPETGIFAENTRTPNPDGYQELEDSMREFGYLAGHPIITDENGVIIVGHRRATVADKLGITPEILEMAFGSGEEADANRLRMALGSNTGIEPLNGHDRKKIAQFLYEGKQWSMAKIAAALNVSAMTVSRDLSGLTNVKPPPERGGRPRKPEQPPQESEPEEQPEAPQEQADSNVVDYKGRHASPRIKRRAEGWAQEMADRAEAESTTDDGAKTAEADDSNVHPSKTDEEPQSSADEAVNNRRNALFDLVEWAEDGDRLLDNVFAYAPMEADEIQTLNDVRDVLANCVSRVGRAVDEAGEEEETP